LKESSITGLTGEVHFKMKDITQPTKLFAHQIISKIAY